MTLDEIRKAYIASKKRPHYDIVVLDYASLYPTTMKTFNITPKHLRNMNRKRSIKSIYEPSE